MTLNFYDFEVFQHDWLVVIINPMQRNKEIIVNDRDKLTEYYDRHKDEIWVGYNSRNYDQYILKGILLGLNPKYINDAIIVHGKKGWQIDRRFNNVQLYNYDTMANAKLMGLKQLEAFMGNNIKETSVPFNLNRRLTQSELDETIRYCTHDVEQTMEVFLKRKSEFDAHIDLIRTFDLPISCVSLTQAQLTAKILGCRKVKRNDEFDLKIVDTLKIEKYRHVVDWFKSPVNLNYEASLETDVCGVPHTFGWGGLHGCPSHPVHIKGDLVHVDVTSYYPSIMIEYDFLTRNCKDKGKFKQIYDKRVELKRQGKKKEQAPYKIILNSTYGICKDEYSPAYDPRQANNVCVNGQLMLLDLLEHLEPYCSIIQSNTDGLIIHSRMMDKVEAVCHEWEQRTGMGLGFDYISEIWQGDVNNYIFRFTNGKLERKGSYVKELNALDNDLPIVNEAIVRFLTEGVSPDDTINACEELIKFQKVVKVSSKYSCAYHNGFRLTDKTFRVFASKDHRDTSLFKMKTESSRPEKFANTPEHCFIYNYELNGKKAMDKLDKRWYIELARERIENKFGISMTPTLL